MTDRLAGKSALITGGGSGIGAATAVMMARDGAAVTVVDRDPTTAGTTVDSIVTAGGRAVAATCDVSDPEDVRVAFDTAAAAHGTPNVVFNNAGISGPLKSAPETPLDEFDRCFAVNVRGVFIVASEFLRRLLAEGLTGAMVNTASVDAVYAEPSAAAYVASKGAVLSLTRALALDHGRDGIRINCICPGQTLSPMTQRLYDAVEGGLEHANAAQAIGRVGIPDEIAAAVVFMCTDEASYMTGSAMIVDGGLSIGERVMQESDLYG
jgi:NAD(P)-dependent dehydrogenase (short-subunit alcohol dehydrogenase family)